MYTFQPIEGAFRVISWGRGIPSTTMAVMSLRGELERVDAIIHCDPGWEHRLTYDVGDDYSTRFRRHGFHVEVLETGDIQVDGAKSHVHVPFWTPTGGQLRRQCTREFKINPNKRRVRELLGFDGSKPPHPPQASIEQWIGFTIEEIGRMRDSGVQFIANRFPLIEKRMSRNDCARYLTELGLPLPPPSSCVGCPYKDPGRWMSTERVDLDQAIDFDERNRHNPLASDGSKAQELFVYRGRVPLIEADFESDASARSGVGKHGQLSVSGFGCEGGYCGL